MRNRASEEHKTADVQNPSSEQKTQPSILLSRDQIEADYNISRRWLELAALTGDGPTFIKIGARTVRYRREELERWLSEREVRSTSETPYTSNTSNAYNSKLTAAEDKA
ncbi:MAG: hypothetical protein NXH80_10140 [Rhodobacteraceae bacterium]|nr:hypothetical protein [Paracoccaceae bacterium]